MVKVYWNSLVSETVRPPEVAEKATETSSAPQWPYFQQHLTEDVTGARSDYFQKHSLGDSCIDRATVSGRNGQGVSFRR